MRREVGKHSLESFWRPDDDARLLQHFYSASNPELMQLFPSRSLQSILSRARRIGLKRRIDPDAVLMGSVSEHHAELVQKYFSQQPKAKTKDYSPYLQAIRDLAISLARRANRQEVVR